MLEVIFPDTPDGNYKAVWLALQPFVGPPRRTRLEPGEPQTRVFEYRIHINNGRMEGIFRRCRDAISGDFKIQLVP